ncbi:hypothetical protein DFJ73DRAFT_613681, partial [Zopfochytrium polystomum]
CGLEFYGYPVAIDYGGNFTDYNGFVQLLQNLTDPVQTASALSNLYACSPSAFLDSQIQQMRYQLSYFCSEYVYRSIVDGKCAIPASASGNLTFQPAGPPICSTTCATAELSLETIISNATLCSRTAQAADKVSRTKTFCANESALAVGTTCLAAVSSEVVTCGFRSASLATTGCSTLTATDLCCSSLVAAAAAATGGSGGLTFSLAAIVIAAVTIGLVVGAVGFAVYMCVRRRKASKAESDPRMSERERLTESQYNSGPTPSDEYRSLTASPARDALVGSPHNTVFVSMAPPSQHHQQPPIPSPNPSDTGVTLLRVIFPYQSTLPDELTLTVGAYVHLLKPFDDGWGLGLDPTTGRQGAFPMVCAVSPEEAESLLASRQSVMSAASSSAWRSSGVPDDSSSNS